MPAKPTFDLEEAARSAGQWPVCGVDEAGRGPWAGPVVAAAVVLDPDAIPDGLNDSKKLSEAARDRLFDDIRHTAIIATAMADVGRIDETNILAATMWAMAEAVGQLAPHPRLAIVDGNRTPDIGIDCRAVVGGDGICLSVAAASIVAKVTRDRLMAELDVRYPGYGLARHKGYGTAQHKAALDRLGPCPEHRRSFRPIRLLIEGTA